jgi:hypothetical protein
MLGLGLLIYILMVDINEINYQFFFFEIANSNVAHGFLKIKKEGFFFF